MRILQSALKHGYSAAAIAVAIESAVAVKQLADGIILYMGWYQSELLEILVDTKDVEHVVFHCMKTSPHVRRLI
jgi:hypothetical protein